MTIEEFKQKEQTIKSVIQKNPLNRYWFFNNSKGINWEANKIIIFDNEHKDLRVEGLTYYIFINSSNGVLWCKVDTDSMWWKRRFANDKHDSFTYNIGVMEDLEKLKISTVPTPYPVYPKIETPIPIATKKPPKPTKEMVEHPAHYGDKDSPYEVIKIIDHFELNFNKGNVAKYLLRAGKKEEKEIEDLQKAAKYLQFEIERLTKKQLKK